MHVLLGGRIARDVRLQAQVTLAGSSPPGDELEELGGDVRDLAIGGEVAGEGIRRK